VLIGSPTFTADSGYSGLNGVNYIDTGFNPSVVSGGSYNFKQNTASFGAWNIDTTIGNGYTLRSNPNAGNVVELIPYYSGTSAMGINSVEANSGTVVDPAGFYVAVRTASNAVSMDKNGTNINTNTTASGTPENNNILVGYSAGSTSWKVGMWFFGGSLTSGDRANIYTRVYNYMHAIGAV
jgi:hypothetical protein